MLQNRMFRMEAIIARGRPAFLCEIASWELADGNNNQLALWNLRFSREF